MDTPESLPHQIDQYEAWQRETIRRHGWALQAVLGDEESPPFVYTVGLAGFRHPELILFATTQATAAAVLNELGELVRAGRWLAPLRAGGAVHRRRPPAGCSPSRSTGCSPPTTSTALRAARRSRAARRARRGAGRRTGRGRALPVLLVSSRLPGSGEVGVLAHPGVHRDPGRHARVDGAGRAELGDRHGHLAAACGPRRSRRGLPGRTAGGIPGVAARSPGVARPGCCRPPPPSGRGHGRSRRGPATSSWWCTAR